MKLSASLIFLSVALAGCGNIGESIGDAVAEKATEKILEEVEATINVKDAFIDGLDHVFVTFGEVQIASENGTWIPAENQVSRVDLLAYQEAGTFAEIARFTALNINYTAMRLPILDVEAEKDGQAVPVQLHTEVIEVDAFMPLEEGFAALIDFDLSASFDDDGNFHAAVKNVQLSSEDADGDGIDDFRDTDDDNDGLQDHQDDDVDGDGKPDAPTTKPQSFDEAGVDKEAYERAPPKQAGVSRFEAESQYAAVKQQGASGAVADTQLISFPGGYEYEITHVRWYADCEGETKGEVEVRGWDSRDRLTYDIAPFSEPCGWVSFPTSLTVDGSGMASVRIETDDQVWFDFVDYKTREAPQVEREPEFVEGESSTNGVRRNIEIPTGMARQDAVDPVASDDSVAPWNFTLPGYGAYEGFARIAIDCNENADVVGVGFAWASLPWDGDWLVHEYSCGQGYREFALPGSVEAGEIQLYVRYDFDAGPLSIDSLRFQPV